jgi:hypothetical protein
VRGVDARRLPWKAFRTEFYPTYDLREAVKMLRERALKK